MKKWGAGAMCGFSSAAHRHIDRLTYRVIYIPSYGKWLGPVYDVQLSFWGDGGMFFFGGGEVFVEEIPCFSRGSS